MKEIQYRACLKIDFIHYIIVYTLYTLFNRPYACMNVILWIIMFTLYGQCRYAVTNILLFD